MSHKKKPGGKERDPESWLSWKFPQVADMTWQEKNEFMIEDLGMSWGKACGSLKKCWKAYHAANRRGQPDLCNEYAEKILTIQRAMGIQEAEFGIF